MMRQPDIIIIPTATQLDIGPSSNRPSDLTTGRLEIFRFVGLEKEISTEAINGRI